MCVVISIVKILFRSDSSSGSISLTGDAQADADIMAFLKARQKLAKFGKHVACDIIIKMHGYFMNKLILHNEGLLNVKTK